VDVLAGARDWERDGTRVPGVGVSEDAYVAIGGDGGRGGYRPGPGPGDAGCVGVQGKVREGGEFGHCEEVSAVESA
jgi:hypothetical protein